MLGHRGRVARGDRRAGTSAVAAHADATIDALALDSARAGALVVVRPEVPLLTMLVHVVAGDEPARRARRHRARAARTAQRGRAADNPNLPTHDAAWWENYRARVERAARAAAPDMP